ncbi:MAG: hypothetical protein OXI01_07985, partial [Albidovulum sp.]|nr:hypothetical protein [Albidovulum sp.]
PPGTVWGLGLGAPPATLWRMGGGGGGPPGAPTAPREQANRKPRKLDGAGEAQLVASAPGEPPEGCSSWTLKLPGERPIELEVVDRIPPATVGGVLKETRSSRGSTTAGASRRNGMRISQQSWRARRTRTNASSRRTRFWRADTSRAVRRIRDIRKARKACTGKPAIVDCKYGRIGAADLFTAFALLEGWRRV